MLFCQQRDIALSLTPAAPISKCFRRPCVVAKHAVHFLSEFENFFKDKLTLVDYQVEVAIHKTTCKIRCFVFARISVLLIRCYSKIM